MKESFLICSKENMTAAILLFDNGLYSASANRAYYAAFHAALAFVLSKGFTPEIDHRNVLSLFINEFINKKKLFPSSMKNIFYKLQDNRNNADYRGGASKKQASDQLKMMKEFINAIYPEIEK